MPRPFFIFLWLGLSSGFAISCLILVRMAA